MEKARLTIDVGFDPELTDAESIAEALDRLLENALSTEGILDEVGDPTLGNFSAPAEPLPCWPSVTKPSSASVHYEASPPYARHTLVEFSPYMSERDTGNLPALIEVLTSLEAARQAGPIRCKWWYDGAERDELVTFDKLNLVERDEYDGVRQFAVEGTRRLLPHELEIAEKMERAKYEALHAKYGPKAEG